MDKGVPCMENFGTNCKLEIWRRENSTFFLFSVPEKRLPSSSVLLLRNMYSVSVDGGLAGKVTIVSKGLKKCRGSPVCVRASVASTPLSVKNQQLKIGNSEKTVRIGVLGASGYTGAEIVRLLANHPYFAITVMTADRKAGQPFGSVFPHLNTQELPNMVAIKDADFSDVDAVFCCLPHGTTQEIIKGLPEQLKVVDLSADFRLKNIAEYEEWYGQPHKAPKLQEEAVYGLTEIYREEIENARLVANPGCYPTSIQLPLMPLIEEGLIELRNIIIDAKSGVSGAGRGAKEANLYTEIAEGMHSYGITKHRHVPEIEQGLSGVANSKVTVSFTPHLMPMSRGMQSTIYVEMASGVTTDDLYHHLIATYKNEEFVKVLGKGVVPHTRHVRGSNYRLLNVFQDRIPGRAIIISVIDNLVKACGLVAQVVRALGSLLRGPGFKPACLR
ncbi:N-acetyl-gamma-glutamyl-phosphate reductase [Rhynchospora pubera]|uniref:Probable N-acetyl-gamma-glutamyl-phosphate reductase, chloroplastic n=1 Tax=Rhynchospora pubera TaxID=906938 RepID=A0AAV8G9N5_9POAL|nr:N-acetyl-gamma-glutamyl-phosphate reductase [Rhynchospora pubera]